LVTCKSLRNKGLWSAVRSLPGREKGYFFVAVDEFRCGRENAQGAVDDGKK